MLQASGPEGGIKWLEESIPRSGFLHVWVSIRERQIERLSFTKNVSSISLLTDCRCSCRSSDPSRLAPRSGYCPDGLQICGIH